MNDIKEQLSGLNKNYKKSVALYHKLALTIGVPDSSLGVLYALLETEEPCSQLELCKEWHLPRQTVNTAVIALQAKGLVSLTPVRGAKNKKNIALTKAGKEFAEKYVGVLLYAELCALSEMQPDERELYVSLNRKYNECLTEKLNYLMNHPDAGFEQIAAAEGQKQ